MSEMSRVIEVADLASGALVETFRPGESERAEIARRLGLDGLGFLEAEVTVETGSEADEVLVHGHFRAEVTQTCVISLDPVQNRLDRTFETLYSNAPEPRPDADEEEDPPEPIIDGRIDIGEEVVQQLALSIDPYPRAPGATVDARWLTGDEDAEEAGPFAALGRLKSRQGH